MKENKSVLLAAVGPCDWMDRYVETKVHIYLFNINNSYYNNTININI